MSDMCVDVLCTQGQAKEQAFSSHGSCTSASGSPQLLQHLQGFLLTTELPLDISLLYALAVPQALGGMSCVLAGLNLVTNMSQAPPSSHCPVPVHTHRHTTHLLLSL